MGRVIEGGCQCGRVRYPASSAILASLCQGEADARHRAAGEGPIIRMPLSRVALAYSARGFRSGSRGRRNHKSGSIRLSA
jgi:hypothetical protein